MIERNPFFKHDLKMYFSNTIKLSHVPQIRDARWVMKKNKKKITKIKNTCKIFDVGSKSCFDNMNY